MITTKTVEEKLAAYIRHKITMEQLVDWAETAMMEGQFDPKQMRKIRNVVSRLSLADVRAFGLTWEDCEKMLKQLGYTARVEIARV